MGAAFDLMCENEVLEEKIKKLQRKNREIKKDLIDFINGLENPLDLVDKEKAEKLLKKYSKSKKTK